MGQLTDRLSNFIKSEFSGKSNFSTFNDFPDDEAELKRIIDELEKGNHSAKSHKSDNKQSNTQAQSSGMTEQRAMSILGVSPAANANEIKSAYIKRIKEYHPDKVAGLGEEIRSLAEKKSQEINEAYNFIKQVKGL